MVSRDRLFRELLAGYLRSAGLRQVWSVHSPQEAALTSYRGSISVVVLCHCDGGRQLTEALSQFPPDVFGAARLVAVMPSGTVELPRDRGERELFCVCPEQGLSGLAAALEAALLPDQGPQEPRAPMRASATDPGKPLLTARQQRVLEMVAQGWTSLRIGLELGLSRRTVDAHRANLMRRLEVNSAAELVREALRRGLIH